MKIQYKSKYLGRIVRAERVGKALVVDQEHYQIYLSWTGFPLVSVQFESFKLAKQVASLIINTFGEDLMYLGHETWLKDLFQISCNMTPRIVMADALRLLENEEVANQKTIEKCTKQATQAYLRRYRRDFNGQNAMIPT